MFSLNWILNEYSKSKPLASLNQSVGFVYDDLAYDEDFHHTSQRLPALHIFLPKQWSQINGLKMFKAFRRWLVDEGRGGGNEVELTMMFFQICYFFLVFYYFLSVDADAKI